MTIAHDHWLDDVLYFLKKPRGVLGNIRNKRIKVKERIDRLALTIDNEADWFTLECKKKITHDIDMVEDELVALECEVKKENLS